MRLKTALAQLASVLALGCLQTAWAQTLDSLSAGMAPAAAFPKRFEQVWEVVEIMGKPLAPQQRPARVALRGQGGLLVDGGCNYFSGRFEHDAQGQFRVSKYTGTHGSCEAPPRSEALLNSALVLVNGYRWDNGLVLSSEGGDLVRLRPSANQDTQEIEQALARRAPAPVAAAAPETTDCRPVKAKAGKSRSAKAKAKSRHKLKAAACQPAKTLKGKAAALKAGKGHRAAKAMARSAGAKSRHRGKLAAKAATKSKSGGKSRKRGH